MLIIGVLLSILPCFLTSAVQVEQKANSDTLRLVHVLWRHGDRTPIAVLHPDEERTWPEGLGELTKLGMAQQYRLGQWIRKRYDNWLGLNFNRQEVYVRSSDYNRTLMSALSNMAGLFPPQTSEKFDDKIPWQPVPIHTIPTDLDKELHDAPCKVAEDAKKAVWTDEEAQKIAKEHENLIQYIRNNSGIPNFSADHLWIVYDALFCQTCHIEEHPWPTWVNQSIFEQIAVVYNQLSRLEVHTETLKRLRGGPLLQEIYERMLSKSKGTLGNFKFYAYSAHDSTIESLLSTLNLTPDIYPTYATAVMVELHQRTNKFFIEVYHKNGTDVDTLFKYHIPGCEEQCELGEFYDKYQKYMPTDWQQECGMIAPKDNFTIYIAAIVVLSLTTLVFGSLLIADVVLKRRPIGSQRLPLIDEESDDNIADNI